MPQCLREKNAPRTYSAVCVDEGIPTISATDFRCPACGSEHWTDRENLTRETEYMSSLVDDIMDITVHSSEQFCTECNLRVNIQW